MVTQLTHKNVLHSFLAGMTNYGVLALLQSDNNTSLVALFNSISNNSFPEAAKASSNGDEDESWVFLGAGHEGAKSQKGMSKTKKLKEESVYDLSINILMLTCQ